MKEYIQYTILIVDIINHYQYLFKNIKTYIIPSGTVGSSKQEEEMVSIVLKLRFLASLVSLGYPKNVLPLRHPLKMKNDSSTCIEVPIWVGVSCRVAGY